MYGSIDEEWDCIYYEGDSELADCPGNSFVRASSYDSPSVMIIDNAIHCTSHDSSYTPVSSCNLNIVPIEKKVSRTQPIADLSVLDNLLKAFEDRVVHVEHSPVEKVQISPVVENIEPEKEEIKIATIPVPPPDLNEEIQISSHFRDVQSRPMLSSSKQSLWSLSDDRPAHWDTKNSNIPRMKHKLPVVSRKRLIPAPMRRLATPDSLFGPSWLNDVHSQSSQVLHSDDIENSPKRHVKQSSSLLASKLTQLRRKFEAGRFKLTSSQPSFIYDAHNPRCTSKWYIDIKITHTGLVDVIKSSLDGVEVNLNYGYLVNNSKMPVDCLVRVYDPICLIVENEFSIFPSQEFRHIGKGVKGKKLLSNAMCVDTNIQLMIMCTDMWELLH